MSDQPLDPSARAVPGVEEDIFETIYFAACEASCELAELHGSYESYQGSPVSRGAPVVPVSLEVRAVEIKGFGMGL